MTDYGHPITFGLSLYPSLDLVDDNTRLAQEADEAGLDYIAIQDHAYNREFLDTWTLISYLAAETERITFVLAPHSELATFAGEVVPAVRERVSDRRATKPAAAAASTEAYGVAR